MLRPGLRIALRLLRLVLIVTTLCFAAAASYMSFLIFERQESLSKVSHYDLAWSAGQGVNEFLRFYQRMTVLAQSDDDGGKPADLELRYQILKGRLAVFQSPNFQAFVNESAERQAAMLRFSVVMDELDRLDIGTTTPADARRITGLIAPLETHLIGLASEAAQFSSDKISEFEHELRDLHRNFSITALGFFICGLTFIALLGWHNGLLSKTQRHLKQANSELQSATDSLARMARHDLLTGLPNRLLFREHINEMLASAGDGPEAVAVMCLDLDNFKNINDTMGHPIGDALLSEVAGRLTELIGAKGIVARFGGDEFVIALRQDEVQAAMLAEKLVTAVGRPYELEGHLISVGVSVGVAMADMASSDPETLFRNADQALYRAKDDGRGTFRFYAPDMDAELQRKQIVDFELRAADIENDFDLLFQPLFDLHTKNLTCIEALLRWPNRSLGDIVPDEFISLAEDNGLIVPLGEWVLRKACHFGVTLPEQVSIAVNLSAVQFRRSDILATVQAVLAETGLPPTRLELEITETLLLDDSQQINSTLKALRNIGVRISVDDFGTGFSSLAYLRKFTVDKLKIDRSFISDIVHNAEHIAIVQAIVGLANALGLKSVAEGVESEDQLMLVRASGCDEAQGYLFGPPVSKSEIASMVADGRRMRFG